MAALTIQQAFDSAFQHHQAGRLREAEELYRQILARQPKHTGALHYLGVLANQQGRNDIAVDLIRQAIALNPKFPGAYSNLGNALKDQGQIDEAVAAYRQAIVLYPNLPEAYNNLGTVLRDRGQLDEAIAAYRQAIVVNRNYADAHYNLGIALKDKGLVDEAVAAFRQAIAHNPNFPEALNNLGNALKDKGQLDEAIAAYRQAMSLAPDIARFSSNFVYTLYFHPRYDAHTIAVELRRWDRRHAEPQRKFIQPHSNDRDPDRRLRLGYVSADFADHVIGRNIIPLFRQHDRRQFDVTCYSHVACPDAMTGQFQQNADSWRNIVGVSDEQAAKQIREDRIDILVDLTLHMARNRLLVFARKPAPVQATFAGSPCSTGLSAIDYRLSDPYLDPPGMDESVYSEKIIRLPDSFWCYDPLDCLDMPVNSLPALDRGFITFGCLNNFCKINEDILALWARVLRQVDGSRLLLLAHPGDHRQRTMKFMARQGVEPGRLEFLDPRARRQYLELYHRIDLGLDSFPVNGHNTSMDSLWMGVPAVTLVGQDSLGRAGWCQLSNLGLTELAGQTPEQFVRIAVELAKDLPRLKELRGTLRQRMERSPLMDAPRFARNIEAAYRRMWRNWCEMGSARS